MPGHRIQVEFIDFLKVLLKRSASSPITDVDALLSEVLDTCVEFCNGSDFQEVASQHLTEYCQPQTYEREGDDSFSKFINGVLEKLEAQDIAHLKENGESKFPKLKQRSRFQPRMVKLREKQIIHQYELQEPDTKRNAKRSPHLIFISKNYLKTLPESLNDYIFRWPEVLTTWELKLINSPTRYQYLTDDFLPKGTAEERYSTSAAFLSVKTRSRSSATPTIGSNTSSGDDLSESASTSSKSAQTSTPQNTPHPPPNAQNAMYACEMLCRGIYSRHSINFLVVDDLVVPWWYDRQNAIQTNGLNFVRDAPHFVALIVLLQRFGMEDWGVEADLAPPSMFLKRSADLEPVVVNFGGDLKAEVQRSKDNYLHLPGLILKGRATTVIDATSNSIDPLTKTSLNGKRIVVKVYWPETWRLDEPYIISEARLRLEKSSLISNIPHLIASREISSSNTGNVTREFGLESAPQGSNARVLRILLFPRLVPMDEMTNEDTIIHAWFDCFECHYALWKNGIEHGDISVWNLMWDNTNMCGVLNDWDLAHIQGSIGRGHERTGTLPFMARDLLTNQKRPVKGDNKPIQRLYRHEVESFIWVFTWMCAKDDIPDEINQWRKGDNAQIRNAKDGFLYRFYEFEVSKKSWDKCQLLLYLLAKIGFDVGFRREHRVPDDQGIHDIVLAIMRNEVISVDGVDDFILKSKK